MFLIFYVTIKRRESLIFEPLVRIRKKCKAFAHRYSVLMASLLLSMQGYYTPEEAPRSHPLHQLKCMSADMTQLTRYHIHNIMMTTSTKVEHALLLPRSSWVMGSIPTHNRRYAEVILRSGEWSTFIDQKWISRLVIDIIWWHHPSSTTCMKGPPGY